VENPRKHFELEGHSEFTTTGASAMLKDMLDLCDMPMTKAKLLSKKASRYRATHLIRASCHRPVQYYEQRKIDDYGNNMPTRPAHYMSNEDTSSDSGTDSKTLLTTKFQIHPRNHYRSR
jgi:hypothetical protein